MHPCRSDLAYPSLVIDGSGSSFFAGVLERQGKWMARITADTAPLESLFPTVEKVLLDSGLSLDELRSYIYCAGPGSVLGLRLCAMALETWSRLNPAPTAYYGYNSLELTAAKLVHDGQVTGDALLISDWKKEAWNGVRISEGRPAKVAPIQTEEIESWQGALFHLPARKGWQKAPEGAQPVDYRPEELHLFLGHEGLLNKSTEIELYSAGANTFQKWTPDRHRATKP
jgi:tRNA threonylcarbamoyladenosine biosynthesis protein TsaB